MNPFKHSLPVQRLKHIVSMNWQSAIRLSPSSRALPFMPDRWTNQRLTLEPSNQFGFEYTGSSKRCNPPEWQTVVFCQAFNRVLTQPKKFCDFSQLQPLIRITCHSLISSFSYCISRSFGLSGDYPKSSRRGQAAVLVWSHAFLLTLRGRLPRPEFFALNIYKVDEINFLGIRRLSFDI